jgi:hypothetical protein
MLDYAGNNRAGAFDALDLVQRNVTLNVISFVDIAHRRMFRHPKHETRAEMARQARVHGLIVELYLLIAISATLRPTVEHPPLRRKVRC